MHRCLCPLSNRCPRERYKSRIWVPPSSPTRFCPSFFCTESSLGPGEGLRTQWYPVFHPPWGCIYLLSLPGRRVSNQNSFQPLTFFPPHQKSSAWHSRRIFTWPTQQGHRDVLKGAGKLLQKIRVLGVSPLRLTVCGRFATRFADPQLFIQLGCPPSPIT
jgi:hypothetical protein